MGTSRWHIFRTITLPGARYGVISAAFVVFTLVITDFGIPKVIGGQFNVLATDAYKQVVGQQNFAMGAVVGMVLLVPAVLAFAMDRFVQRRQVALQPTSFGKREGWDSWRAGLDRRARRLARRGHLAGFSAGRARRTDSVARA